MPSPASPHGDRRLDRRRRGWHGAGGAAVYQTGRRHDIGGARHGTLIAEGRVHSLQGLTIPAYAAVYRIHGPFLFGATDKLDRIADHITSLPPVVIIRLRHVPAMDASGLQALEDLADQLTASGRTLLLCGAREQPAHLMERAEFHQHVGDPNILPNIQEALKRAHDIARELRLEQRIQLAEIENR
jgi:sulfate permease, SulP family